MNWRAESALRIGRDRRHADALDGDTAIGDRPPDGHDTSAAMHRVTRRQLIAAGGLAATTAFALRSSGRPPVHGLDALFADAASAPTFHSRPDLQIPALSVAAGSQASGSGLILVAPYGVPGKQAGPVIVDQRGELVWEQPLLQPRIGTDFRVQTFMGRPVLTWFEGRVELGHGVGSYVIADAAYKPLARVNAGNGQHGDLHEFLLTDRDTALLTTYRVVTHDLRPVGGSANGTIQDAMFQEIDLASGKVLMEWHSLDHIALDESYYLPIPPKNWDYVHLNSIAVDTDQNLLVCARNTHAIYKLDRSSGEIIWRLGGKRSTFAIEPTATFGWQHDARRQLDGTITIFDNGATVSRALVLNVDERHHRATLRHAYVHPANLYAVSQGSVQVLPNGNIFIGWGSQPYVSEFTASGELVFDARLGAPHYISYRAYQLPWTGEASGTPAVATQQTTTGTNVYVSWNGDTRVARWTALGGTSATKLAPLASVPRTGFETLIRVPRSFTHLRVQGTDASGKPLTTGPLVTV
jgi:hypothetical protein